jgi:hypothetical protein
MRKGGFPDAVPAFVRDAVGCRLEGGVMGAGAKIAPTSRSESQAREVICT